MSVCRYSHQFEVFLFVLSYDAGGCGDHPLVQERATIVTHLGNEFQGLEALLGQAVQYGAVRKVSSDDSMTVRPRMV